MERFKLFTDSDTCLDFGDRLYLARKEQIKRFESGSIPVLVAEVGSEFYAETILNGEMVDQRFTNERDLLLWIGMHSF